MPLTDGVPGCASGACSGNHTAVYSAGILRTSGVEADRVSVQFADKRDIFFFHSQRPDNILKFLNESDLAVVKFPDSVYFRRNNPEMGGTPVYTIFRKGRGLIRFPVRHVKAVGDYARTWLHVQDFRP